MTLYNYTFYLCPKMRSHNICRKRNLAWGAFLFIQMLFSFFSQFQSISIYVVTRSCCVTTWGEFSMGFLSPPLSLTLCLFLSHTDFLVYLTSILNQTSLVLRQSFFFVLLCFCQTLRWWIVLSMYLYYTIVSLRWFADWFVDLYLSNVFCGPMPMPMPMPMQTTSCFWQI